MTIRIQVTAWTGDGVKTTTAYPPSLGSNLRTEADKIALNHQHLVLAQKITWQQIFYLSSVKKYSVDFFTRLKKIRMDQNQMNQSIKQNGKRNPRFTDNPQSDFLNHLNRSIHHNDSNRGINELLKTLHSSSRSPVFLFIRYLQYDTSYQHGSTTSY